MDFLFGFVVVMGILWTLGLIISIYCWIKDKEPEDFTLDNRI